MKNIDNSLMVSVCMISYNHMALIEQAIDSVLSQKTDYKYEIVIGDDCSTDDTPNILRSYAAKHPDKFRLLLRNPNVGVANNFSDVILQCKGKYIAILEGDDYWIDDNKLQKQVEFMEKNPTLSLCYTHCKEVNESKKTEYITNIERPNKVELPYILKEGWFMRTPTLLFRNGLVTKFPEWFFSSYSTDYILHLLLAEHGSVGKMKDVTAVYRKHEQGISVVNNKKQLKRFDTKLKLLDTINEYYNLEYSKEIKFHKKNIYEEVVLFSIRHKMISSFTFHSLFKMDTLKFLKRIQVYFSKSS